MLRDTGSIAHEMALGQGSIGLQAVVDKGVVHPAGPEIANPNLAQPLYEFMT